MTAKKSAEPELFKALETVSHVPSSICTQIEREFIARIEAGCSAPIGVYCTKTGADNYRLRVGLVLPDLVDAIFFSVAGSRRSLARRAVEKFDKVGGADIIRSWSGSDAGGKMFMSQV